MGLKLLFRALAAFFWPPDPEEEILDLLQYCKEQGMSEEQTNYMLRRYLDELMQ